MRSEERGWDMVRMLGKSSFSAALLAGAVLLSPVAIGTVAAQSGKVGVAAAVKNDVQGIQAGSGRSLSPGSSVFERETVRTGAESVAQLLFLDQTSLSVGPRSEVVLDEFVYNPSSNTGDVVLSATRGAFRFISGSQNPLSYKINTPVAPFGVRGTILVCAVGSLTCAVSEGAAVIVVNGVEYRVEAGEAITVNNDGTVTGPYQHDGTFDAVNFGTPWPLYGSGLPSDTWRTEVPDSSTQRIEDLFEHEDVCPPNSYFCGATR
jgi:hypothetical protein